MSTPEERLARLETDNTTHKSDIVSIKEDVKEIKDKLLLRPSWSVTVIITLLSTICTGLIVFIVTNLSVTQSI